MKMPRRVIYNSKFCNWMKINGCVLWPYIHVSCSAGYLSYSLYAHEMTHWKQIQEVGVIRFYLSYFWQQLTVGYQDNKWEQEPRIAWAYPNWYDEWKQETGDVIGYWEVEKQNRKSLGELGQFL